MNTQLQERVALLKLLQDDDDSDLKTAGGLMQLLGLEQKQQRDAANFTYEQEVLNPRRLELQDQQIATQQVAQEHDAARLEIARARQELEAELASKRDSRDAQRFEQETHDRMLGRRDREVALTDARQRSQQQGLAQLITLLKGVGHERAAQDASLALADLVYPENTIEDPNALMDEYQSLLAERNLRRTEQNRDLNTQQMSRLFQLKQILAPPTTTE